MEIYRFAFIILLSSLLVSCGEKKQETGNADKAAEKKTPAFTLPEVPVMLQSVEDRLHFVVNHYWDKFDFKDTAYIHAPDITEQAMANYIDLLTRVPQVMADSCVTRTLENVSLEPKMLNYFVETLRKYLFDPNSPMRNEEIFEPVCRFVASYASADEAAQSRARYDLKLIDMNRVGSVAADFVYTLASGAQRRMHDLRSPYTLLLFYNPDCHGCAEVLAHMKSSPVLTDAGIMKQVSILAFYPDEEYEVWKNHRDVIPSGWINGYDKELTVLDRELYDLKAMPTLYLLDKDKKVLLEGCAGGTSRAIFGPLVRQVIIPIFPSAFYCRKWMEWYHRNQQNVFGKWQGHCNPPFQLYLELCSVGCATVRLHVSDVHPG